MAPIISSQETEINFVDLTPKKFILLAKSTSRFLWSKWKIILFISLLCGLSAGIYTFFKNPDYVAEITFTVDESIIQHEKSGLSDISEELGFGPLQDAGTVFSSLTNIVELIQSRLLIEKTLRKSIMINKNQLVFADFFLDSLNYRKKWTKNSPYYGIKFQSGDDEKKKLFENQVIRNIYEELIKKNIKIEMKGKGTTIISVACTSVNELFSMYFLEALLNEVTHYYIETKTQRSKINLSLIEKRTDSMRTAYYAALYGKAVFSDAHINPIRQRASVPGEKQLTDVQILKTSYIELVRSLETAKISLMRDTPLIQFLDTPILPLKVIKGSLLKRFLLFFFLGGFLFTGWLLIHKAYTYILLH